MPNLYVDSNDFSSFTKDARWVSNREETIENVGATSEREEDFEPQA